MGDGRRRRKFMSRSVYGASRHEQETLGATGSNRKSQQYTPQPLTLDGASEPLLCLPGAGSGRVDLRRGRAMVRFEVVDENCRRPGGMIMPGGGGNGNMPIGGICWGGMGWNGAETR